MPFSYSLFTTAPQRRWWLSLAILVLIACMLMGSVWLYYAKQVEQLDQQLQQLPDSLSVPHKPS
ncbi:hypothetical protein [Spirosoma panaciterrae]|uniref:hypothetical protein n=1 Tax=Spirosoma panaciterrae TaxID=496058 RepID=UPI00035E1CB1|nr:hypothetical protein [Spirosoma panaciterrae]